MNEFFIVAVAHLLAVMSPGPDLAIMLSVAARDGIGAGIKTAAGIAAGIGLHVAYCLVGVALILKSNQLLFDGIRIAGSLYLLWLAWKLAKGALASRTKSTDYSPKNSGSGFKKGFVTNALNPKVTLFFLALFTQVVSQSTPGLIKLLYGAEMVVATFLWFTLVSMLVGNNKIRVLYQRRAWIIELIFALVLSGLGLFVLLDVLG